MPERMACDEAIQFPQARLKVSDPDLKEGHVEMFSVQNVTHTIRRPWGIEGGFAVVYKFRTQSGRIRALRCFRVPVKPDTRMRYERIGPYFATYAPAITAEFSYYEGGIQIKENNNGQFQNNAYPLIEMEWIEGVTLIEHVDELCKKQDCTGLKRLLDQWANMLGTMQKARIAHGDLAGSNIMVRPNGSLVLIDYDGVYIPDFAGLPPVVAGQPDYQHPQLQQRPFNEHMDSFSALAIYTALLVLQEQPELWDKYTLHSPQGKLLNTSLLFIQQDFLTPDSSALFSEIEQIKNTRIQAAIQELKQACALPVDQVTFPWHLIDPYYDHQQALIKLKQAIQGNDDEAIVVAWIPALLDTYAPAQQYNNRVVEARCVVAALTDFRAALQSQHVQQIVSSYDPLLDYCKSIQQDERDLLRLAQNFVRAYQDNDDEALATAHNALHHAKYGKTLFFTPQEIQRITLAYTRRTALAKFRNTLNRLDKQKNAQQLIDAYDTVLDACQNVTREERAQLDTARNFMTMHQTLLDALASDDDGQIEAAYRAEFTGFLVNFTPEQQRRVQKALKRSSLDKALESNDYASALRIARELEKTTHTLLTDFRLTLARQKFIKQFDAIEVEVHFQGDEAIVYWLWPEDDLIEDALIVWRVDRWPRHPKKEELGTVRYVTSRHNNELRGIKRFRIYRHTHVYIHVYLAIADYTLQRVIWFYSNGDEPTSRKMASQAWLA